MKIRKKIHWRSCAAMMAAILLSAACGGNKKETVVDDEPLAISTEKNMPGDSTLYGLACDGCTDSVIVILPNSGGNPDTIDIINAALHRQVYGKPRIGDKLAVIRNPEDPDEALMVVNMDNLKGNWCYLVMPQMRDISKMPKRLQRRMVAEMPDSEKQALLIPKEVGYQLKREYIVRPIGIVPHSTTTEDQSMVEYPKLPVYQEWRLFNGRIIFTAKHQGTRNDTADFVYLKEDSMVLRFSDRTQAFYRKK